MTNYEAVFPSTMDMVGVFTLTIPFGFTVVPVIVHQGYNFTSGKIKK